MKAGVWQHVYEARPNHMGLANVGASSVSSSASGEHNELCWRSRTADEKRAAEGYKQLISGGTRAFT